MVLVIKFNMMQKIQDYNEYFYRTGPYRIGLKLTELGHTSKHIKQIPNDRTLPYLLPITYYLMN